MLTAEATVATLRAGDDVDAVFACSRKDRLTARSGLPYLAIELRDRSGAIQGRAFRDADLLSGRFERGELVRVTPSSRRTMGRVDWKSTKSSGSMLAKDSAPRLPAMKVRAEVADSPASFQPLNAHTSAGARSPSGRRSQRSGCIDSRYRVRCVPQY